MAKRINPLEGSLWDKILAFALPLAATSIIQQLFNSCDVATVGQFSGSLHWQQWGVLHQLLIYLLLFL